MAQGYWQTASSGTGGGTGYLGAVATTTALGALSSAVIGSVANVGASAAAYILYELKGLPYSTVANWQPLQGLIPDGTLISIEIVPGKLPRTLLVYVPLGNKCTVTVGGTTLPVLPEAVSPHIITISDEVSIAAPTSVTIQRTTGSAATGWFSLEG